ERSTQRAWDIATATLMPIAAAIRSPTSATIAVWYVATRMSVRTVPSRKPSVTTSCGGGRRNRRWGSRPTYVPTYQAPITRPAAPSGGTTTPARPRIPRPRGASLASAGAGAGSSSPTCGLAALRVINIIGLDREVAHRIGHRVHDLDVLGREPEIARARVRER